MSSATFNVIVAEFGALDAVFRGEAVLGHRARAQAAHRLHGGVDRRVRGDHDDVEARALGEQPRQEVEAALLAEAQIAEREVEGLEPECLDRRRTVRRLRHAAPEALQADRERGPDVFLVVDDEDAEGECGCAGGLGHGGVRHIA